MAHSALGAVAAVLIVLLVAGCGEGRSGVPGRPPAGTETASEISASATPATGTAAGTTATPRPTTAPPAGARGLDQALIAASREGSIGEVRRLLAAGASVRATGDGGETALVAATQANQVEVATVLIAAGADVNAKDSIQDSAYLYAAAEGRLEILKLTLANGADLAATNRFGGTGLIPAAHHGHVEIVRELLKTSIAIDHVNNLGWTALLEAVILGQGGEAHTEIVRLLLAAGARPDLADGNGVSPLAHARSRGQRAIAALIEAALARKPPTTQESEASLLRAAAAGEIEAVRSLLARGANIEARGSDGSTALTLAARGLQVQTVRLLLAAGADVNAKDNRQESAYLIATSEIGDSPAALEILRLTLANGADVTSLDSYNGTGLIRAADRGFLEIVRELLTTRTDKDHVNNLGWTALLEAIILGGGDERHTEVVRLLVSAGAHVNLADGAGVSPLAHARSRGYAEMVRILEAAGAR